jgi:hypothetical protein
MTNYLIPAIAVLSALEFADAKLTYSDFAKAIGLRGRDEPWKVAHRSRATELLNAAQEADSTLQVWRIVTVETGQPGPGYAAA